MCFSATGSFVAAAINGVAGAAALRQTSGSQETVFAAFPVVFAAQQTMEGALWIMLPGHVWSDADLAVTNGFIFVALVAWPLLVPLATSLQERNAWRRAMMIALLMVGVAYAAYYAREIIQHPFSAQIVGRSISYENGKPFSFAASALYCACTCLPLLISTQSSLKLLGFLVLTGLVVSYGFYFYEFLSVWCFFAALASGLVFFRAHFEVARHLRHPT